MSTTTINGEERDKIIEQILAKVDRNHSVSVNEVIADFRSKRQESDPNYDLRITTTLMEGICTQIISIGKDKYNYKNISRGEFTQYIITKNPGHKNKTWYEKKPVHYEWFKAIITGVVTLIVAIIIWIIDEQKGNQDYKELKQRVDLLNRQVIP